MLLVWPLSGHCLTRAFKKRKRNRRWTKGANEEHGARKSCETLTAERAKRLQLSCAVGLFVIPYAREAVIPSQLFFFFNHATLFGPWKYFRRPEIFLLDMFTARQTATVTELMLRRAVHRLFSIFDVVQ